MALKGRGLLGRGSQLVGLCGAEPGLFISLCYCKVPPRGEDTTSVGYARGWMCQISGVEPGEMFSRQGNFLVPLIPSLVWGQLGGLYDSQLPPHKLGPGKVGGLQSYPDSCLRQVGPDCNLLPGAHVWVTVSLESGFQLLELLTGEVRPLPPLLLLEGAVFRVGVVCLVLLGLLGICARNRKMGEIL